MTEAENSSSPVFVAVIPLEPFKHSSLLSASPTSELDKTTTNKHPKTKADGSVALFRFFVIIILGFLCEVFIAVYSKRLMSLPAFYSKRIVIMSRVASRTNSGDDDGGMIQQHAIVLTSNSFDVFLKDHPLAIVKFCAGGNARCQVFHRPWQDFALEIQQRGVPLAVGEVNCDIYFGLCPLQRLKPNPMVVWFRNGVRESQDTYWIDDAGVLIHIAMSKLGLLKFAIDENRTHVLENPPTIN